MKVVLMTIVLATLAACGRMPASSELESVTAITALSFSRDKRPVDGTYDRLDLKKGTDSTWTAVITTIFPFSNNTKQEEIEGLSCSIATSGAHAIVRKVYCSVDNRLVDGPFYEIVVKQNPDAAYDAVKKTTIVSRINGQQSTKEEIIGEGLYQVPQ